MIDGALNPNLENLEPIDIEEYLDYLKVYVSPDDKQITNTERGLARKFSSLSSFYRYLYRHKYIVKNPTIFVDKPKIHEKAIMLRQASLSHTIVFHVLASLCTLKTAYKKLW